MLFMRRHKITSVLKTCRLTSFYFHFWLYKVHRRVGRNWNINKSIT